MIDSTLTYQLDNVGALNGTGTGFGDSWLNSY